MRKTLKYILIGLLFTACGFFGDKVDFFKGIDFNTDDNWLIVHSNPDNKTDGVIYNNELLKEIHKDLVLKSTSECGGTTPDYNITLYKNGKWIKSVGYCSWEPLSYQLGRMKKEFVPSLLKSVKAHSIESHDFILDSLNQLDNVYLLYPKDTTIEFPDQLKFDIKLINKGQDIFEQEKPIEKEFNRIFNKGNYEMKAVWHSSLVGPPRKLGYHIIVDCDSSFLNVFDSKQLQKSELFKEMTNYKYLTKEFWIRYYQWDE